MAKSWIGIIVVVFILSILLLFSADPYEKHFSLIFKSLNKTWINTTSRKHSLTYYVDPSGKYIGKRNFSTQWMSYLEKFGLLNDQIWERPSKAIFPQFVTAFTNNHFNEIRNLLSSFVICFKNSPETKIIIYDLGISASTKSQLLKTWGKRVILRNTSLGQFPPYVSNLQQYRWKPLLIAQSLFEFRAIWWLDSSSVLPKSAGDFDDVLKWTHNTSSGIYLPMNTHNIKRLTYPVMYEYFPLPLNQAERLVMYAANRILIYRCPQVQRMLQFWLLCALEKECMAPTGSLRNCNKGPACHRFDQSAINMILGLENAFNEKLYFYGPCPISTKWLTY